VPRGEPRSRILAIDATPEILDLYRDLLGYEGYRVFTRQEPPTDLAEIARLAPDCIIVDCMRVGDEGGWEWLQHLRADPRTAAIPVVVCTGAWDEIADRAERLASLGVGFVPKPFDIEALLQAIRDCLDTTTDAARSASAAVPPPAPDILGKASA
jgi:DNA-binding response OmpR family regulator